MKSIGLELAPLSLQINLIASWFNYINRVADGLGVGRWQRASADAQVQRG